MLWTFLLLFRVKTLKVIKLLIVIILMLVIRNLVCLMPISAMSLLKYLVNLKLDNSLKLGGLNLSKLGNLKLLMTNGTTPILIEIFN